MIAGEREDLAMADDDVVVGIDDGLLDDVADGENRGLRRIDDGVEAVDAEHAEVGDGERAALEFVGLELAVLGFAGERLGFAADLDERFVLRFLDDGGDEAVGDGDGEGELDVGELADGVALEGRVDGGDATDGLGGGLEDEIVEAELDRRGEFAERFVELHAEVEHRLGIDVDLEIEMGDGGLALEQALGDDGAHGRELGAAFPGHGTGAVDGATAAGGRMAIRRGVEDVILDDASAGTGAGERGKRDAFFGGDFFREGRGFDAATGRGGSRGYCDGLRSFLGRRGLGFGFGGCGGRRGCGGGRLVDLFILRADDADLGLDRNLGAFLNQNLAEDAGVEGLEVHGGLVGFDLGDDFAGPDRVAFLLEPFDERALGHGGAEQGHENVFGHRGVR